MKGLPTKQKFQLLDIADNIQKRAFYKPGDEVAFITLMRICRDYVDKTTYPAIKDRDTWLLERLKSSVSVFMKKSK